VSVKTRVRATVKTVVGDPVPKTPGPSRSPVSPPDQYPTMSTPAFIRIKTLNFFSFPVGP
jgi:hypothetical protein